jgi:hypothetical protein
VFLVSTTLRQEAYRGFLKAAEIDACDVKKQGTLTLSCLYRRIVFSGDRSRQSVAPTVLYRPKLEIQSMATPDYDFDPYHKWLGIPAKKRPPNYYDLLALSLDEEDLEVIRGAAKSRRHSVESQRGMGRDKAVASLLYQIDEAELVLLDSETRRDYDRRLNLFHKRRRNRQFVPAVSSSRIESRPGSVVGEGSGIVQTFLGVMAVLLVGFGVMAWFSFQLPWRKMEKAADAAPMANVPIAPQPPRPAIEAVPQPPVLAAPQVPQPLVLAPQSPVVVAPQPTASPPAVAVRSLQPQLIRLQELDPPPNGCHAGVSGNGLTVFWEVSGRVLMAQRRNADSLFENQAEVSCGRHPYLSGDGLELFTVSKRADGGQGDSLYVATRPSVDATFSRPRELVELNRQASPKSPWLSSDDLSLYFTRTGPDGKSPEFVVATRLSKNVGWTTPKPIQMNRNGISGALTWMSLADDERLLLCTEEPAPGPGGSLFVWTKQESGEYANRQLIKIDSLAPLMGRAPRYVSATRELYFTKVVDRGKFELWVVRDLDLNDMH